MLFSSWFLLKRQLEVDEQAVLHGMVCAEHRRAALVSGVCLYSACLRRSKRMPRSISADRATWPCLQPGNRLLKTTGIRTITNSYRPLGRMRAGELRSYSSLWYIAIECFDGSFAFYRLWNGRLECTEGQCSEWSEVPADDMLQHVMLRTPVGVWLDRFFILCGSNDGRVDR